MREFGRPCSFSPVGDTPRRCRRALPPHLGFVAFVLLGAVATTARAATSSASPNIVIIFTDDLGYADVGTFGAKGFKTPNLDRLANQGMRFTDFYVSQAVCSASRAALLTGCYSNRVGILGALGPGSATGINAEETTIAELLKQKDYATAAYGKWHLGDRLDFLPTEHGFDDYFGLPYSNDMWPSHPTNKKFPDLPLIEKDKVLELNPDQSQLTTRYTERAVAFIEKNEHRPFFLYLAHSMPHVPLFVSDKFKGSSEQGLYGDVIQEIDWSVGQVMDTIDKNGLSKKTLIVFISDNGPWLSYGNHAGSALPLREGKGTSFDGGARVPCLMRWTGKIPADSVCREPAMTIDLLPTIAYLTGAKLPDHTIDGKNIWPLMAGEPNAKSPQEAYYFYYGKQLQGIRQGKWKLHFPHPYRSLKGEPGKDGTPSPYVQKKTGVELYDLDADIGEREDVANKYPDVVARLKTLGDQMRAELGDSATKQKGAGARPPGRSTQPSLGRPDKKS
ncbi:Arylsulfatase [Planctomycetes bacterium Pan216]|uniref:Arylsulfatase n=1 Tax=Kolteria novifilia TaxID=2527975 RepID=A0A518B6I0_9BACT|nr:Arylsulfatase [Planctomycetes bacterium Pan216]